MKYLHKFHNVDGKQTKIIDEIEFELPYGILRKLSKVMYTNNFRKSSSIGREHTQSFKIQLKYVFSKIIIFIKL